MTLGITLLLAGCSASDLFFGAFDKYYSGGGSTSIDRRYDYDRQQEAWDRHNRYGSLP
jgi:hypothetical protein